MKTRILVIALALCAPLMAQRWTAERAQAWYAKQGWLVGANYGPATAINQLEMWQAESWDPKTIDKELALAEGLGMTTMRVFLHDLVWAHDQAGYRKRIEEFLAIAARHKIKPMLVLFDSVWDPEPKLGKQRAPMPGVHNSGWMQGPGAAALADLKQEARLEAYVKGVVGAFGRDARVLAWDVWNEPDNMNDSSYSKTEFKGKRARVLALLPKVFAWARSAKPEQPLTCGVWQADLSSEAKMGDFARLQINESDVISFHNYSAPAKLEQDIVWLERYKRPILCTEYMARGNGSTFAGSLPVLKKHNVAAYNWGFVAGKTQTNLPWDSWQKPYVGGREPAVWFHEIYKGDLTPYKADEVALIKKMTGR